MRMWVCFSLILTHLIILIILIFLHESLCILLLPLLRNTFSAHIMLIHHVVFVANTNLWPSQRSAKIRIVLYHQLQRHLCNSWRGYYCMAIKYLLSLMTFIYFFKINIIKLTGYCFPCHLI